MARFDANRIEKVLRGDYDDLDAAAVRRAVSEGQHIGQAMSQLIRVISARYPAHRHESVAMTVLEAVVAGARRPQVSFHVNVVSAGLASLQNDARVCDAVFRFNARKDSRRFADLVDDLEGTFRDAVVSSGGLASVLMSAAM